MRGFIKCDLPQGFGTQHAEVVPQARVREVDLGSAAVEGFAKVPRHTDRWALAGEHPSWIGFGRVQHDYFEDGTTGGNGWQAPETVEIVEEH